MKPILILLAVLVTSVGALASQDCTRQEAILAEDEASSITSWPELYRSHSAYAHCDDGAIAEGYSWSIMKLLSERWDTFSELIPLWADERFRNFIIKHIDETFDQAEASRITDNLSRRCPAAAKSICSELAHALGPVPKSGTHE